MSATFPKHWTMRRDGSHYNAAPEWHGYGGRCDQEPRLSYIDRHYRNGSAQRDWKVDGLPCATMAEAWERLQVPPAFTPEEMAVLATLTDEPTDLRKVHPYEVLRGLRDKGAASANMGRYVITDAGRVVLALRAAITPTPDTTTAEVAAQVGQPFREAISSSPPTTTPTEAKGGEEGE